MVRAIQLLKQLRNAAATIYRITDNPEFTTLLASVDLALNTLQLQGSPAFHLQYLEQGRTVLAEGRHLMMTIGTDTLIH